MPEEQSDADETRQAIEAEGRRSLLIAGDLTEQRFCEETVARTAQPEELAPAYVFLASEADSSFITGEILNVMGGKTTAG